LSPAALPQAASIRLITAANANQKYKRFILAILSGFWGGFSDNAEFLYNSTPYQLGASAKCHTLAVYLSGMGWKF
jgi:hypothetical protein